MKLNILISVICALCPLFSMAQISRQFNPIGATFATESDNLPSGTYHFISGGYEIYTIASADKSFQPASLYYGQDNAHKAIVDDLAPDGKVPTAMNCFVVHTPDGYIMFDTGLPASRGGKTLEHLSALHIAPTDIKAIFITHGHFDHIGALLDASGNAEFPSATLYIAAEEMTCIKSTMTQTADQIEKAYSGKIATFSYGEILPGNILPISAKGHTPGHTVYQLGNILFAGDIMHGPALQLIHPEICAGYDADRAQSVSSRLTILRYAADRSLTLLCAHAPLNGIIF